MFSKKKCMLEVQKQALVVQQEVKFSGGILQVAYQYDLYKVFEDLFMAPGKRKSRILEEIQSLDLYKLRSNAGDTATIS